MRRLPFLILPFLLFSLLAGVAFTQDTGNDNLTEGPEPTGSPMDEYVLTPPPYSDEQLEGPEPTSSPMDEYVFTPVPSDTQFDEPPPTMSPIVEPIVDFSMPMGAALPAGPSEDDPLDFHAFKNAHNSYTQNVTDLMDKYNAWCLEFDLSAPDQYTIIVQHDNNEDVINDLEDTIEQICSSIPFCSEYLWKLTLNAFADSACDYLGSCNATEYDLIGSIAEPGLLDEVVASDSWDERITLLWFDIKKDITLHFEIGGVINFSQDVNFVQDEWDENDWIRLLKEEYVNKVISDAEVFTYNDFVKYNGPPNNFNPPQWPSMNWLLEHNKHCIIVIEQHGLPVYPTPTDHPTPDHLVRDFFFYNWFFEDDPPDPPLPDAAIAENCENGDCGDEENISPNPVIYDKYIWRAWNVNDLDESAEVREAGFNIVGLDDYDETWSEAGMHPASPLIVDGEPTGALRWGTHGLPFLLIQEAIARALDGMTIQIEDGTYYLDSEDNVIGKPVTLVALIGEVVIDAEDKGCGEPVVITQCKNVGSGETEIDILVVKPDGLFRDKNSYSMPRAAYTETEVEGLACDIIEIPCTDYAKDDYDITPYAQGDAQVGETFSLSVKVGANTIVLANNLPILDIPQEPYNVSFNAQGAPQASPVIYTNGPLNIYEGSSITLSGSGSYDPDGIITSYAWDLDGDEIYETPGQDISYTWADSGVYEVGLRVEDDDGFVSTTAVEVRVIELTQVLYVNADSPPGDDGTSWENAFDNLQAALDVAAAGDQIWVASGTYTPAAPGESGTRTDTFQLIDGVALYGGFSGTETALNQRDWETNVTVLSGDVGSPSYAEDNCYHVVSGSGVTSVIFDGFTVSGGYSEGDDVTDAGAGLRNWNSELAISDCAFKDNYALIAGGLVNANSSVEVTGCSFVGNEGGSIVGGAINYAYANGICSVVMSDCVFDGNAAGVIGGLGNATDGSENTFCDVTITNCDFTNNTGGALYSDYASMEVNDCNFDNNADFGIENHHGTPTITNCFISHTSGEGIYNSYANAVITKCTIMNTSGDDAVYNYDSDVIITDCTISNTTDGRGMYNNRSNPIVTNCTFWNNTTYNGAGMYNYRSDPVVTNCTFHGNEASNNGGAIYNDYQADPVVTNSIFWENTPEEIYNNSSSTIIVTYSDIEGGYEGSGNITGIPMFINPGSGDFHLDTESPCINAGTNSAPYLPDFDFEGDDRIINGVVDMGVDETGEVIYVNIEAVVGDNNGTSWENAFDNLQAALAVAAAGDQIWVASGTYTPAAPGQPGTRTDTFELKDVVALYGGFSGTETALNQRDWVYNVTVLSGDVGSPSYAEDNCYHVVSGSGVTSVIFDGFTVSGGYSEGDDVTDAGAGMKNWNSELAISNCTFKDNYALIAGGLVNANCNAEVSNCTFTGNQSVLASGAANYADSNSACSVEISNCVFDGNTADNAGALANATDGSENTSCDVTITNCDFTNNTGGALYSDYASMEVNDCTFDNNADFGIENHHGTSTITNCLISNTIGEGIYNSYANAVITECTITNTIGEGIYNYNSNAVITECTITNTSGDNAVYNSDSDLVFSGCTISNTTDGRGMYNYGSILIIANCTFWNNGDRNGAGIQNYWSDVVITNCTFAGNAATSEGGALSNGVGTELEATNCIFWGNTPEEIYNDNNSGTITVTYSDIEGGYEGTGNITGTPMFINYGSGDFHLDTESPCINTGTNAAPNLPDFDFEGDDRIINGVVDMGVDEYIP